MPKIWELPRFIAVATRSSHQDSWVPSRESLQDQYLHDHALSQTATHALARLAGCSSSMSR